MGRPLGGRPQQGGRRLPQRRNGGKAAPNGSQNAGGGGGGDSNKVIFSKKWLLMADKERTPFPEELFESTFSRENIEKLVTACRTATEKEVNESRRLLPDDYMYSMHIISHRTPHVPVHLTRILLPHSVDAEDSNVCLFVKDLKRGRRLDYEPTIKHYEQLLKNKNVKKDITIIPVNQLYNEFCSFEMRRKLTYLYDRFLVDRSIGSHINGFLGPKLLMKCRTAIPINLESNNLVDEIDQGLRKVFYKHNNTGVQKCVQVGRHSTSTENMIDNIIDLIKQLNDIHPGGTNNIHKLYLKSNVNISVAVPIYVNLEKPENIVASTMNKAIKIEKDDKLAGGEKGDAASKGLLTEENDDDENDITANQETSVVGDDMIDDDKDEMTEGLPKKFNSAGKKNDEAKINDLIVKNIKKIVGNNALTSLSKAQAAGSGTAKKTIANRSKKGPARSQYGNRGNRGGNDFGRGGMDFSRDFGGRGGDFGGYGGGGNSMRYGNQVGNGNWNQNNPFDNWNNSGGRF